LGLRCRRPGESCGTAAEDREGDDKSRLHGGNGSTRKAAFASPYAKTSA
jgi:hypothetical protein